MNNRSTGTEYETKAVRFLLDNGYRIRQRNFYSKAGEIDIITESDGYLCFVEVKYRGSSRDGYPYEAVDIRKMKRITKAAMFYMNMCRMPETTPCRFDVVSILGDEFELIKNAFDAIM